MHIPDGFLSPPVWATLDLIALPTVCWAARRVQSLGGGSYQSDGLRQIPLMGVMGAFVFSAQMINFPVAPGVSGHLLGGSLLALTLGPGMAAIVLTAILTLQSLLFQDGGILALGANVFNMALAGVAAGYLPSLLFGRKPAVFFLGGFLSVALSGLLALTELLASGVAIPRSLLLGSFGLFLASGLIEGAITLGAMRAIQVRGSVGRATTLMSPVTVGNRVLAGIGLAALFLASCGFFFASADPDGLQKLTGEVLVSSGVEPWLRAPFAGYVLPSGFWGISSEWLRRALAVCIGASMIFGLGVTGGRLFSLRPFSKQKVSDVAASGD